MNRKYTSLFLFLVLIMNFLIFFPSNVSSESISPLQWEIDFDEYLIGATSGTGSFYTWARTGGDDWEIVVDYIESSPKMIYSEWSTSGADTSGPDTGNVIITNDEMIINTTRVRIYHNFFGYDWGGDGEYGRKEWNFYRNGTVVLKLTWKNTHFPLAGIVGNYNGYCIYNYTDLEWNKFYTGGASGYGGIDSYLNITVGEQLWAFNTSKVKLHRVDDDSVLATASGVETGDGLSFDFFDKLDIIALWDTSGFGYIRLYDAIDTIIFDGLFSFIPVGEDTSTEVIFNLYDSETLDLLRVFGNDFSTAWLGIYAPAVRTKIYSDLWSGDYNSNYDFLYDVTLEGLDISENGEWHYINFTNAVGNLGSGLIVYYNSSNYIQLYPGQTYTVYLSTENLEYGGFSNCGTKWGMPWDTEEFGDPGWRSICTDKEWYTQGESVTFRYVAPNPQWLFDWGSPSGDYFIWIYDVNNLGLWIWETDGGIHADNYAYMDDWAVSLDNNYHYKPWNYNATGESGYKTVTGGVNEYHAFMGHRGGGFFDTDYTLTQGPTFYIQTGDYTPYGNITSVSPSNPMLGQFVNISFNANNNGYLTVKNVLAPGDTEETITNFQRFTGIESVNRQFFEFGSYELRLYVSSGLEYTIVDTETFDITDVNGSFGDFGYGIEFLSIEPARAVAGYDVVFISYRSLDSTGEINVLDARGQTTSYGALVGEKRGVLNITLPNHAAIGEWNITLTTANNTLYSSFQVIAEENNYVEFYSNVFLEGEQFRLKLKHSKKVELVFYKDGQAIGTDWYLDIGTLASGIYPVPLTTVTLTPGSWKVEMWEVNNFVKIRKMAEDTCIVIERPIGSITEGGYDDIFSMLTIGAASFAGEGFGLAFMAIIFILVTIVALANLKLKNDTIFFGAIIMALFMAFIGWLPIWIVVIAIILSGLLFSSAFSKKLKIGG